MRCQIGTHRRMAMKVDIGIERARHLGTDGLGNHVIALAAPAATRKPFRFLRCDEALVKGHLAALADLDIDIRPRAERSSTPTSSSAVKI